MPRKSPKSLSVSPIRNSMRNIKLTLEYDGTNYCGWQMQAQKVILRKRGGKARPHRQKKSIQETIERLLQRILCEKIRLIVSGRTDAGVHALGQVANFKTNSNIALRKLRWALNGLLPEDIVITRIEEVNPHFHSRFAAKGKVYRYIILNRNYPAALLKNRVYFYPYPLDIRLMRRQACTLLGRHDFAAFCASGSGAKDTTRTIKRISIKRESFGQGPLHYGLNGSPLLVVDIEADGFLYNMVRNIVGTLIEIGRGRFPEGSLKKILLSRNRKLAGPNVPARGLCLLKVKY
jgi:tRNA pseudouridine38-40 synthase